LLFFFIHLGSTLNLSLLGAQVSSAVIFSVFVLVGNPLIVMIIMGYMGYRKRTGFLAGLTVAQISEFSLILIGLGATLGHVSQGVVGLVTLVGLLTIAISTYMILYSDVLYRWFGSALSIFERDIPFREKTSEEDNAYALSRIDVLIFGLGQYGGNVVRGLIKRGQQVIGVDFDPQILRYWREQNVLVLYGDMSDPDLLEHLPIRRTRWLLATAPDREVTTTLVNLLRHANYPGKLALTARTQEDADYYKQLGADLVLCPFVDAADQAVDDLNAAMHFLPTDSNWPTSLIEVRLETGVIWAGKALGAIPLRRETGVSVLAVSRAGTTSFDPPANFVLYPGDRIVLLGEAEALPRAVSFITQREFGTNNWDNSFTIASVDIPDTCGLSGNTLAELNFRQDFGVTVIGIERKNERIRTLTANTTIEKHDRLVVVGCQSAIDNLHAAIISACNLSQT
jgi:Trk K+ transport system NAD-binding subunit